MFWTRWGFLPTASGREASTSSGRPRAPGRRALGQAGSSSGRPLARAPGRSSRRPLAREVGSRSRRPLGSEEGCSSGRPLAREQGSSSGRPLAREPVSATAALMLLPSRRRDRATYSRAAKARANALRQNQVHIAQSMQRSANMCRFNLSGKAVTGGGRLLVDGKGAED